MKTTLEQLRDLLAGTADDQAVEDIREDLCDPASSTSMFFAGMKVVAERPFAIDWADLAEGVEELEVESVEADAVHSSFMQEVTGSDDSALQQDKEKTRLEHARDLLSGRIHNPSQETPVKPSVAGHTEPLPKVEPVSEKGAGLSPSPLEAGKFENAPDEQLVAVFTKEQPSNVAEVLLRALLQVELEYRVQSKEAIELEHYQRRFPLHADLVSEIARRIEDILKGRPLAGTTEDEQASSPVTLPPPSPDGAAPAFSTVWGSSRYKPIAFHKAGGLGEVYKAYDEELSREVALKCIKVEHADNPRCQRDFLREAEITGRLEHPGVVPIYGLIQGPDGNPSYAMRFIEGESLKYAIHQFHAADKAKRDPGERAVAFRQLLNRFIAVCNTLAFAHNRGIIHCDLKPANIMLGKYGETLVVDWGLACPFTRTEGERASGEETRIPTPKDRETPDATKRGDIKATLSYMSPEQAEGRWDVVGPASDIYSLGATLYELLTGVAPMRGGDYFEVLSKARRASFSPPRSIKFDIAKPLEAICLKAMKLDRADRYQTADLMGKDLELWLADEPVSAYREPWYLRLRRLSRRHRTLVASLVSSVLDVCFLRSGAANSLLLP
jgi:serine/threonine protein kinase